jgi:tetratricopeptide (TPR) repeat protein
MPRLAAFSRPARLALLVLLVLAAAGVGWAIWQKPWRTRASDPILDSPSLALEFLNAKVLYFNGPAREWLIRQRPGVLDDESRDEGSDRSRGMTQAAQNPKLFRQLDRKYRFDALLLVGDPSQYTPLLDHLKETRDWTLRYADHTSLVFRRDEGKIWDLDAFAPVRTRIAGKSPEVRATVLALTATRVNAAGFPKQAKQLLDEASGLAPRVPDVANAFAVYYLTRGQFREAAPQVNRALAADPAFLPALATKAQLYYGTKRYSEAYELSKQVIERLPENPVLLFYHAKIAHEAHAYQAEIDVMEKLIRLADNDGHPLGGYQLYLGQAYASAGDAKHSIDAFMAALSDPDLPSDQREFARDNIVRIKKRSGQ